MVFGAHPAEYKRVMPPNSYIHVDDFTSIKELAQYLLFLSRNDDMYNQYLLWKNTGRFVNTKFMCRLCTMVHLAPYFPMWYDHTNEWWRNSDTCTQQEKHHDTGLMYGSWRNKPEPSQHTKHVRYGYKR